MGKATGWAMDTDLSIANASYWGENAYDASGFSVAGAGDVNGDGYDDILIGAKMNDDGSAEAGQTYLILSFNDPPKWLSVPELHAVEDVPFTYDFSASVSDADTLIGDLGITSPSPYVTSISGLEVTFNFPNNVTDTSVPLMLSDGVSQAVVDVTFTVQPVNDPPAHDIPQQQTATEDVPWTIDLSSHVWDIDNDLSDLSIWEDSPYTTIDGLKLTVLFPEGVLEHTLLLNISDGLNLTVATIHFTVTPVNDPPVIGPLAEFTAVEDQVLVLNLTSYLSDMDTPIEALTVEVSDTTHCTVVGQELHFLYTVGGKDHYITITISDGYLEDEQELTVHVQEVNDAPVVTTPPPLQVFEDERTTMYLTVYVWDEETARDQLVIECEHPAVVGIEGLGIALLYTTWEETHSIQFTVFDGLILTNGNFDVQVQEVNDAPVITGLGDLSSPTYITVQERSEGWYLIHVEDEDSTSFAFTVESDWTGVSALSNGTLHVLAGSNDFGEFPASLIVDDRDGGIARLNINITVVNVNDLPVITELLPSDGTEYKKGKTIVFSVTTSDADGDALTITWKNGDQVLGAGSPFEYSKLSKGEHVITIVVDDGTGVTEETFKVKVTEEEESPSVGLSLTILAMVLCAVIAISRRGR